MVFGRLLYLPSELVWRIIRESCSTKVADEFQEAGKIQSYEFWPRYDVKNKEGVKTADNRKYVEPDVVIHFSEFTLIIEAKAKDNQNYVQTKEQWTNELHSYRNVGYEDKVVMLSIGGNTDLETFELEDSVDGNGIVPVYKATWIKLLQIIYDIHQDVANDDNIARVLSDLKETFTHFKDYYIKSWLADIPLHSIRKEAASQITETWKIQHI